MSILNVRRPPLASPMRPTWVWDFARYGRVPAGATYTGSGGTFVGSNGLIQSATTNVPRFDYDPATLSPLGYLAEMGDSNFALRSEAFDNAAWTKGSSGITADNTTAPDGNATADRLTEDNTLNAHYVYQQYASAFSANTNTAVSVFVKAGTRDKFFLNLFGAANDWVTIIADLATGTISQTATGATTGTLASSTIRAFGNGWYRIGLIGKVAAANPYIALGLASLATGNTINTSGAVTYTGTAGSTMYGYIWGAMASGTAGVGVTSYIPTAGATASRAQDVLSLPLTSLPGWSATQGGVLVAAYRLHTLVPSSPGYDQPPASMIDGGVANYLRPTANESGAGRIKFQVVSASASQLVANLAPSTAVFTRTKMAGVWGTARIGGAVDGAAFVGTSGSYSLPSGMTNLYFGSFATQGLNGTLESIAYYRGARSDAFVQAVSR